MHQTVDILAFEFRILLHDTVLNPGGGGGGGIPLHLLYGDAARTKPSYLVLVPFIWNRSKIRELISMGLYEFKWLYLYFQ